MSKLNVTEPDVAKLELQDIVERMRESSIPESAWLLQELIDEEQELSQLNLLKAYDDKVPLVLQSLEVSRIVDVLNHMDDYYIMKALFGNFRTVDDRTRGEILRRLDDSKLALLLMRMSVGVDIPVMAARILVKLNAPKTRAVVNAMGEKALIRLFREMGVEERARILERSSVDKAVKILNIILENRNRVRLAHVASVLRHMDEDKRNRVLKRVDMGQRQLLEQELSRKYAGGLERMTPKEAKAAISDMQPADAAERLREVNPEKMADILRLSEAGTAAAILTTIAREDAKLVLDILAEINSRIIVGFKQTGKSMQVVEEVYMCPSASILELMDFTIPENIAILEQMNKQELEMNLERMAEDKRAKLMALKAQEVTVELPFSLQLLNVGGGTKKITKLDHGLKWTRIEEVLDTGEKTKPVLIDLVEIDPQKVTIKACRAINEDNSTTVSEVARIFGEAKRGGKRPGQEIFAKLGIIQLSKVVKQEGAIAAINGNHYFDYGHYMDALKIGIDPVHSPGLFFGDPVGWFVADGVEVSPPSFNRASCVVTKDGNVYIDKVFMTCVTLSNGIKVNWDSVNSKKEPGKTILYNSLFGFKTEKSPSHIDVAVARGQIFEIAENGDVFMPLTGFILSIPREAREQILRGVKVGDRVAVENNFPASLGDVEQAMACGPHLVRNGQLDISFKAEDFGDKDSSVMSFSLTRAVETFEAARSFMMLRDGRLFIGTVGGTALGSGAPTESGGMTFGELAQLTMDLRADHAYALDGGGSSSIAVLDKGEVRCLTIPTGGADVAEGEERFINTYWMFFAR